MDEPTEVLAEDRIRAGLTAEVPQYYFNGFAAGMGSGDVAVLLERNGLPIAFLNMSFTVAKTLALALGTTVGNLEQIVGQEMLTTHDVDSRMAAAALKEQQDVSGRH